jgi:hypothetical protein
MHIVKFAKWILGQLFLAGFWSTNHAKTLFYNLEMVHKGFTTKPNVATVSGFL